MKKILAALLITASLFADSLSVSGLASSKHFIGDFNEGINAHKWIGLEYVFIEDEDYEFGVEIAHFKNSYWDNTTFYGVSSKYTPIHYKNIKAGIALTLGRQRGYCVSSNFKTNYCEKGSDNTSYLVLPTGYIEWENFYRGMDLSAHFAFIPNIVAVSVIKLTVAKWNWKWN